MTTTPTAIIKLCRLAKRGDAAAVRTMVDADLGEVHARVAVVAVHDAMHIAAQRGHNDVLDVLLTRVVVRGGEQERNLYESAIHGAYHEAVIKVQPSAVKFLLPRVPHYRGWPDLDHYMFSNLAGAITYTCEVGDHHLHTRLLELLGVIHTYIHHNRNRFSDGEIDKYGALLIKYAAKVRQVIRVDGIIDVDRTVLVGALLVYAHSM